MFGRRVLEHSPGTSSSAITLSTVAPLSGLTRTYRGSGTSACESEQQYVVILVRNEGQSQLDQGKKCGNPGTNKEKDGPWHAFPGATLLPPASRIDKRGMPSLSGGGIEQTQDSIRSPHFLCRGRIPPQSRFPDRYYFPGSAGYALYPPKWHVCGWIERIPVWKPGLRGLRPRE